MSDSASQYKSNFASPNMWEVAGAFLAEVHNWYGVYGRKAFGGRPLLYAVSVLLAQLLLGQVFVWFFLLFPLMLFSIGWVFCCATAKRARNLHLRPLPVVLIGVVLVFSVLGTFLGITAPTRAVFWLSLLALVAFIAYIGFTRGKPQNA